MHLELVFPEQDYRNIDKLKLGNSHMRRDASRNAFFLSLSDSDHVYDVSYVEGDSEAPIASQRDLRHVLKNDLEIRYRMNNVLADFLVKTNQAFGPFRFAFYDDEHDPFTNDPVAISSSQINAGTEIKMDVLFKLDH